MTFYFSAAIAQKKQFGEMYERIVKYLRSWGHTVLQDTTEVSLVEAVSKSDEQRVDYYRQVLKWIDMADATILEVSFPSTLHIGHEVSLTLEKGKPVIALYFENHEPSFFLGLQHEKVFWSDYDETNLRDTLEEGVRYIKQQSLRKFNFKMESRHYAFLDEFARHANIPKAVYLRHIIEKEMQDRGLGLDKNLQGLRDSIEEKLQ